MKLIKFIFFIFAIILSMNVAARTPVPIINYDNIAVVTTSGKTTSSEQVKQAIQAAAAAKNWSLLYQPDGHLQATLSVQNGKHIIVVDITYASDKYSLIYKNSTQMKYGTLDGQAVIHPFYNKWVHELKEAIRIELMKF
jgi:glyceraldehyde-3-phosphate dehydrogenase/erythrose-4-phosphate dehydrogenase